MPLKIYSSPEKLFSYCMSFRDEERHNMIKDIFNVIILILLIFSWTYDWEIKDDKN